MTSRAERPTKARRHSLLLFTSMDVVATAGPFYLQHDDQSWKHEKATISVVADFVASLPSE